MTPLPQGRNGRLQATFVPGHGVPASGSMALWGVDDVAAAAVALGLPPGDEATLKVVLPEADGDLAPVDLPVRLVPVVPATRVLAELPAPESIPAWRRPDDAVLAWSVAAKLALEMVAAGRVVPLARAGTHAGTMVSWWRATPGMDRRLDQLADALPVAAHALRRDDDTVWSGHDLLAAYLDAVADACGRGGRRPVPGRGRTPRRPWIESWVVALGGPDPIVGNVHGRPVDLAADVDEWAASALHRRVQGRARLGLRLHTPETRDGREALPTDPWHVDILLAADDSDTTVSAQQVWDRPSGVIVLDDSASGRVEGAHELLAGLVAEAASIWRPLGAALDQARPSRLRIDVEAAAALLGEVDALRDQGVLVHLPPELDARSAQGLRARLVVGDERSDWDEPLEPGRVTHTELDAARLTDFRYEVVLGDDVLSAEDFAELVALKQPIVRWRDRWIRVEAAEFERMAKLTAGGGTLGFADALAAALGGVWEDDDGNRVETIAAGEVAAFIQRLKATDTPTEPVLHGVEADLRPYQERGVAWLQAMASLGLGAVLADDMGLGKTLQGIALIASRSRRQPHLVVCPTSVVGNWEREIAKFAPGVQVVRHHGLERAEDPGEFLPGRVVVTTYALLRRDIELLEGVDWGVVIFDEAQQIKNATSKGAKAARRLPSRMRVVMTGTPVENRLADLWSLLDVVNPGLLGSQRRFTRTFAVPIERWRDDDAAARLRRMVAPFVLRRRKDDPEVALSLPAKTEVTVACTLTTEQATLYQAAVDEAFGIGLGDDGIGRRGRILRLLNALKQICNHPAHYLAETGPLPGRSGKLARVTEILGEVVDSGNHALVFTQYKKMGDLLVSHLSSSLDLPSVPFLHGGVSLKDRDDMVHRFQEDADAPPLMIVSLRAGGTGLNLTRATEVVHFDRWWNPAVEDQATDRVHRIGQDRPVTVHRLVTAGTVEDRITAVLESKRNLVEQVVGTGETWLTELGDDELRDLVALSMDDVEDVEVEVGA